MKARHRSHLRRRTRRLEVAISNLSQVSFELGLSVGEKIVAPLQPAPSNPPLTPSPDRA